jgi:hypothetical protein
MWQNYDIKHRCYGLQCLLDTELLNANLVYHVGTTKGSAVTPENLVLTKLKSEVQC